MSDGSVAFDLRRLLTETRVSRLTLKKVPVLTPEQSIDEAAVEMREVSHGSAVVCQDGRLVGIITERDLMRLLSAGVDLSEPVGEVMTVDPHTVSAEDRLFDAVRLMDHGGYRRLPVVDANIRPLGVVDVKTVMEFVVDHVPATVYNQAERRLITTRRAEGA